MNLESGPSLQREAKYAPGMRGVLRSPFFRVLAGLLVVIAPARALHSLEAALQITHLSSLALTTLVSVLMSIGVYVVFVRLTEKKRTVSELGARGAPLEFGSGLLLGALLFTASIGILGVLGVYRITGTGRWSYLWAPVLISLGAAVLEEIAFRAILFRIVEESLGTWLALLISSMAFGAVHFANPNATWLGALAVAIDASVLVAAFVLTRRLWLPMGLHFAWNAFEGGVFGVALSGVPVQGILRASLNGPAWLSGGVFGAEASIVAMLVCAAAAAMLFQKAGLQHRLIAPFWVRS